MTALLEFQRLEALGTWRETPGSRRRDVIVSFGDATLILSDPRSEVPLSHWSLPAVVRRNPGKLPALYSPGSEPDEELEVSDELMISAIEKVHSALELHRPHPGRLRSGLLLSGVLLMAVLGATWLPQAMIRHAAKVAPPAQRSEIGRIIFEDSTKLTGAACTSPAGTAALERIARDLLGPGSKIVVLPGDLHGARELPGQLTLIGSDLVTRNDDSDIFAAHLLAARIRVAEDDGLRDALQFAGPKAAFSLLTGGRLPRDALAGYGETLLAAVPPHPPDDPLLRAFATAGVPSEPYARSLDPTGEAVLGLIEADPFRTALPAKPAIRDAEWVALQQICDN